MSGPDPRVSRLARGALAILGASATALAVAPGAAWACSGGAAAAAAIAQAELIGWVGAGMAAVLLSVATVVAKRRGLGRGPLAAGWVLVAVHPGFWVSARSGDCGSVRATGTFLFTALAVAVLIWAFWRPVDAEREPEAPTEGDG